MTNRVWIDIISATVGIALIILGTVVGISIFPPITAVIVSVVVILISIIIHKMGIETTALYGLSFTINSLATGISLSAFYVYREEIVSSDVIIQVAGVAITVLVIMALLNGITKIKMVRMTFLVVFLIGSIITTLILWIENNEVFYSLLFFVFIFVDFHVWGFYKETILMEEYYRQKSSISFGVYILITIVVLIVLSEGDILEASAIPIFDGKDNQKQEP